MGKNISLTMSNQAVFSRSYISAVLTCDDSYVTYVHTNMRSLYRTLLTGTAKCTKASPLLPTQAARHCVALPPLSVSLHIAMDSMSFAINVLPRHWILSRLSRVALSAKYRKTPAQSFLFTCPASHALATLYR